MGFWMTVLGNIIGALCGVIIGIPAGLWLQSRIKRNERRDEGSRRRAAVAVLADCIEYNVGRIERSREVLSIGEGRVMFAGEFDLLTWDALKGEIIGAIREPDVEGRCARFFSTLGTLRVLVERHFEIAIRRSHTPLPESASADAARVIETLREHVVEIADALRIDGKNLRRELTRFE